MREIRFRAWDKENGGWAKIELLPNSKIQEFCIPYLTKDFADWQQFTGLIDENGKEIYEGDILGYWGRAVWQIGWNRNKASFCALYPDDGTGSKLAFSISKSAIRGKGVIGNIYETPDLLTPTKE